MDYNVTMCANHRRPFGSDCYRRQKEPEFMQRMKEFKFDSYLQCCADFMSTKDLRTLERVEEFMKKEFSGDKPVTAETIKQLYEFLGGKQP